MKTNQAGLNFIKDSEGFSATPYLCPAGRMTVGFGHLIKKGEDFANKTLSLAEAVVILKEDVKFVEKAISDLVTIALTDNQFSALVSLVYNIGRGNFATSTLLRKLNDGEYHKAADQFLRWVYARGKRLPGLVVRRGKERELFLMGEEV